MVRRYPTCKVRNGGGEEIHTVLGRAGAATGTRCLDGQVRRGGKARTRATRTRWRHRQPLTCQPREPSGRRHHLPSAGGQSEAVWSPCWGGKSRTMVDPGFELRTPVRRTACQRPGAHGGPARRLGEPRSALRCTEWLLEALPGLRGGWGNGGDVGRPSPRPDTLNTCLPGTDSVRPHRWQPTRLPRPWDSPGNNTEVDSHFLLQRIFLT